MTTAEVAAPSAAVRREGILLLCALLLAAVALRPQLVGAGPLIPDIQDDLGVSHAVAGLVGTIPVLCMGLFAPAAGWLSARWSLRTAMAGCLLAIAIVGIGRALSPGAAVLLGLTLPIGVAMAVAGTLLPVAVKQRFAHRPAFASGIGVTGINIGAAISSAIAVPVASAWHGWRGALAVFSLATLAICAGWLVLSRGAWTERSSARRPRLPLRRPIVWLIVLAFALPSVVYYGLVAWIADAYQERGWSDGASGGVLAVMGVASIPAALVVPWLADRMGTRRLWMWFAAGCMCTSTFGFAAIPGGGYAWAVLAGVGARDGLPDLPDDVPGRRARARRGRRRGGADVPRRLPDRGARAARRRRAARPQRLVRREPLGAVRHRGGNGGGARAAHARAAATLGGGPLMDRGVAVPLAIVIGGTLALQAPLNSLLGRSVGSLNATVVAFIVGLVALLAVSVLAGGLSRHRARRRRAVVGADLRRADQRAVRGVDRLDGARARRRRPHGGDDRRAARGRDGGRPLRLARRGALADHGRQAGRARTARGRDVAHRARLMPSTMRKLRVEWRNLLPVA